MFLNITQLFKAQQISTEIPSTSATVLKLVTADATRCVQCGICSYNCPVGIDVREYARRGKQVTDSRCISCSACVNMCPRGTLRWGDAALIFEDATVEVDPKMLPDALHLQPRFA
ncbi:MAG: 4Fe-4S dicluster domain-containing protein [Chloroflexi bacterium]|nr:4Fe-4S dicluster domain-containing protein [Chloroflexota bacterium]